MSAVANPFSTSDIEISKMLHPRMGDLQSQSDKRMPFDRMIDVWWAGLCIGLKSGQRSELGNKTVKFATGVIFDGDPWRIAHLQLIALTEGGADSISEPGWANRTIGVASEYANYGMKYLFDVASGAPNPTLAIYNRLGEFLE